MKSRMWVSIFLLILLSACGSGQAPQRQSGWNNSNWDSSTWQ